MIRVIDFGEDEVKLQVEGVEIDPDIELPSVRERRAHSQIEKRVESWMRRNLVKDLRESLTIDQIDPVSGSRIIGSSFIVYLR